MSAASYLDISLARGSLGLLFAVVLLSALLGLRAWQRSDYSISRGGQELLRLGIVCLVGFLLCQPEWIAPDRSDARPVVLVLWDDSPSMATQDVTVPQQTKPITRSQACKPLLATDRWTTAQQPLQRVVIEPLRARSTEQRANGEQVPKNGQPVPAAGQSRTAQTDLHEPLLRAADNIERLLAVVLISDGDWNTGRPPVEAAVRLQRQGVPIHTVTLGSQTPLPDIELASINAPSFAVVGKPLRIPVTIESSLPQTWSTVVSLRAADGEVASQPVTVTPLGQTHVALDWTPTSAGDYVLTASVPAHGDETMTDNNARSLPISIRQESLSVLIVDSLPRWEYRYLRNALSRDPGVDVDCLLFQPGLSKPGGGSADYLKAMPETVEALSKYDVVFLGDVGVKPDQLTPLQCELLRGLVEQQAAGLVLLPGPHGHQWDLLDTALSDLIPVVLDQGQPSGWGLRIPSRLELTERGQRSLLTRLADQDNTLVWENLPGFQWYAGILRAKAGSEVLAVHAEADNRYGRIPLIVTRTHGSGKVLFMGTDGAWRWRKGVEDKYHYRFWGQVVRWMAYQRNMAEGESMRLICQPDVPEVNRLVTLRAHVMDSSGEPLSDAQTVVLIETPDGRVQTVALQPLPNDPWGVFQGQFTPTEAGRHELTVEVVGSESKLKTSVHVQGADREPVGKPARPDVLAELSRVTGGKSVPATETAAIVAALGELPPPPLAVQRLPIWSHPLSAALLITLLGLFWTWRKASGLM